ncbi:MAG: hypothetical protein GY811_08810 [Myxococcales bacterium]|nr:hypothetical protein [Myxococcales bacterium]
MAFFLCGVAKAQTSSRPVPKNVEHPEDPFAGDYRPPVVKELGTSAGQVRVIGLLGARLAAGTQPVGQGTVEFMTLPILGLRLSSTLALGSEDPSSLFFAIGPSLHFFPYRRLDVSMFAEVGPARFALDHGAAWSPMLSTGASLDLAISGYWFLRLEGHLAWAVYDGGGEAVTLFDPGGTLGIGFGI